MSKASVYVTLDDINDQHDANAIKRELDALPGVLSVSVNPRSKTVAVDFDTTGVPESRIEKQLEKMGYQIRNTQVDRHIM